jgi:ribosomal protein L39E
VLDLTGIMFSTLVMLFVLVRAVRLDREVPWFLPVKKPAKADGQKRPSWRRQA